MLVFDRVFSIVDYRLNCYVFVSNLINWVKYLNFVCINKKNGDV